MFNNQKIYFIFLFIINLKTLHSAEFLNIIKGPYFYQKSKIGLFSFTTTPQMVLWIESEDGNFKKTLYITKKFGKQEWGNQFYDKNKTFREYTFPFWCNRFKNELPTKNKPLSDSITKATPKDSFKTEIYLPENKNKKRFIFFFEVNNSFDENEFYPLDNLYNGQPSLVYSGILEPNFKGNIELKLIYKTNISGEIIPNFSDITTAKEIISKVEIIIE